MLGFVYSFIVAIVGLILNIVIYNCVGSYDVILYCSLIILAAAFGLFGCIGSFKERKKYEKMYPVRWGIALSTITIVFTVIFMIVDIVGLNTTDFVPVNS